MNAHSTKNYQLGRGVVYFNPLDPSTGIAKGEVDLGNAPAFSLNTEIEELEHFSSRAGLRVVDKKVTLSLKLIGSFTLDEINVRNLAFAFLGDEATTVQGSGSATDEPLTVDLTDAWYKLEYRNIDPDSESVEPDGGGAPYVKGTDYEMDYTTGRILILASGNISSTDELDIDYDYQAITGMETVQLAKNTKVEGLLRFIGNPATGVTFEGVWWKVTLSLAGEVGFITEADWATMEYEFEVQSDTENHPNSPLGEIYKIAEGT